MKPDQNKSVRSRPAGGRREPNPLTRLHESQGPDVRIRGTARHVADKYLQLARDAHTGGNPVQAENYLQHAEHYFRLIAAAEAGPRATGETDPDDPETEPEASGLPDRFAAPAEPAPQAFAPPKGAWPRKVG
jgi:hypothetical protein